MMDLPLVSVITPSYNQADFIEETVLSVIRQDYPHIEHLVLDGASTDGTQDVLTRYSDRIRWRSQPDDGQSDALNQGFSMASGEIIGWLNSDDTYMQHTIATAVDYLQKNPDRGWVFGDGYFIDEKGDVLWKYASQPFDLKKLVCEYQYIVQPSAFFRRDILESVGPLDASLHLTMDYDFFIRMGLAAEAGYIPQVLATRRLHASAKTMDRALEFCTDSLATLDKVFASPDLPAHILDARQLAYSNRYASCASRCLNAGLYADARTFCSQALRSNPNPLRTRTLSTVAIYLQSLLQRQLIAPDRRRIHNFRSEHGLVSTSWAVTSK